MKRTDVKALIDSTAEMLKKEFDHLNGLIDNKTQVIKNMQAKINDLQHALEKIDADDLRW